MREIDEILLDLGRQITSIRIALVISQEQLAERTNLSINHIDSIEQGKIDCNVLDLLRIANALDVNIHSLFSSRK